MCLPEHRKAFFYISPSSVASHFPNMCKKDTTKQNVPHYINHCWDHCRGNIADTQFLKLTRSQTRVLLFADRWHIFSLSASLYDSPLPGVKHRCSVIVRYCWSSVSVNDWTVSSSSVWTSLQRAETISERSNWSRRARLLWKLQV